MIMTINDIKQMLDTAEYDFLRSDERLGKNVCLLTLGGSYAYGTNKEGSDVDIRGVAVNSSREILLGRDFEQVTDTATDTIVYSMNKIFELLYSCNPNTIEILGCKKEHYLHVNDMGQLLLDNSGLFLSQKACKSFAGYANQQLRRLENHATRFADQTKNEEHILRTIEHQEQDFKVKYPQYDGKNFRLYIGKSNKPDMDVELFIDANITMFPIRDFKAMWTDMYNIVNSYNALGARNSKAFEHGKIAKHMMHLVRLYYMAFDILEKEQIVTYREKERNLLMSIRNGEFLDNKEQPVPEFYEMVDELEKRFDYAKKNTALPLVPDKAAVDELHEMINKKIVLS